MDVRRERIGVKDIGRLMSSSNSELDKTVCVAGSLLTFEKGGWEKKGWI